MNLKDLFKAIAYKEFTSVDLPQCGSHQHEINGSSALREFFHAPQGLSHSESKVEGAIIWHFFADNADTITDQAHFTFYDARASTADRTQRTEWRLYYKGDFLKIANPGDSIILVRDGADNIIAMVFQNNSGWLRAAKKLFKIDPINNRLQTIPEVLLNSSVLDITQLQILEELGIETTIPATPSDEDLIIRKFNGDFPTTAKMSEFARTQVNEDMDNSDNILIQWINREEELFRALEAVLIREQLQKGFDDVNHFIKYSLSVQNRRKSRMGYALQNHLAALFHNKGLHFETQKRTEGKNTPDFLFPGIANYLDQNFPENKLAMLAAKSSCKERWRQILTEANRIANKHLCTLEAGISIDQTNEMKHQNIHLVIPEPIRSNYEDSQRADILGLDEFIELIRKQQS